MCARKKGILKETQRKSSSSFGDFLLQTSSSLLSPQKLLFGASLATLSEQQQLQATPSKLSSLQMNTVLGSTALAANSASNLSAASSSFSFECPECKKNFVSYYGLVQHYDQHPNLKVTCMLCEITFESHHSLVLHNTNVHHLVENNSDRVNENLISSNQLLSKKSVDNAANGKSLPVSAGSALGAKTLGAKAQLQFKSKSGITK